MSSVISSIKLAALALIAGLLIPACGGGGSGGVALSTGSTSGSSTVSLAVSESGGPTIANGATASGARDFGSQDIANGATATLSIVLTNNGTTSMTLQTPTLGGANGADFVLNTGSFSTTVAANAATSFTVAFDPTTAGTKNATVSIGHNAGNTNNPFVFSVTGTGTSATLPAIDPNISVSGPTAIMEGNSGTRAATFTVALSQATSKVVSISYATAAGSSNPATAGTDYQTATGTLTFSAGQTSKTVDVLINGDTTIEPNETFDFTISNPSNGTVTTSSKTATITDDDAPVSTGGRAVMAYMEDPWGGGGTAVMNSRDFSAVTHVIVAFLLPETNGTMTESNNFTALKNGAWNSQPIAQLVHTANRKVVFSVGGAAPLSNKATFATIAASPTLRATFIANVVAKIQSLGFDGVDIDYEWPESTVQGQQFTTLMQELYAAVKAADPDYVVMFGAGPGDRVGWKEWAQLGNYCDYCFFFGYDWHWVAATGVPNGPIKRPGQTWPGQNNVSFEASVRGAANYVLGQGFPANKLVIGLPYYDGGNSGPLSVRYWSDANRNDWLALSLAQRTAAIDPDYMEALINGRYVTTPECITLKMDALMDINSTVLRDANNNPVVCGGTGWWEWGKENPVHGELTAAVKAWMAAHP